MRIAENMFQKIWMFVLPIAVIVQSNAQELWMEPDKFLLKDGDSVTVEFNTSGNFMPNRWDLKLSKISRLSIYQGEKQTSLAANEGKTGHVKLRLSEKGTKMIVMQGVPASIEIEAEEFNKYLKTYSLDEAYDHRVRTNSLDKPGSEMYDRCTKLLVQVDDKADGTFKKSTGLPLEIIPDSNPYALKMGDVIRFRVLYEGKPLFGARVFVWNRNNGRTFVQPVYSRQDGTIEARISDRGTWMISVVKMVPSKQAGAQWHSYWSSLVFGLKE